MSDQDYNDAGSDAGDVLVRIHDAVWIMDLDLAEGARTIAGETRPTADIILRLLVLATMYRESMDVIRRHIQEQALQREQPTEYIETWADYLRRHNETHDRWEKHYMTVMKQQP